MSIRFVLGRAGTGKTQHCLADIRARLSPDPLSGEQLILLVPEQAGLQVERALIESVDVPAYARCEVLSFRRLAYRVLGLTGAPATAELTPLGRVMVLRHLLDQHRGELICYKRVLDAAGFVRELSASIAELLHEQVSAEQLRAAVQQADPAAPTAQKARDVATIYAAYLDYLAQHATDPDQSLDLAAQRLAESDWGHGSRIWVDGFAGFTGQETAMLVHLAERAAHVEIALLIDAEDPPREIDPAEQALRQFGTTERTLTGLTALFTERGLPIEPPLLLTPEVPPRFTAGPTLALLERRWAAPATAATGETPPTAGIELFAFPDRRVEVEAALTRIQDLVRRERDPLRYRDIAVIVRDLGPYHDLLAAESAERQIPVFIDRRRPVSHHPLVELLRALCMIVAQDFSRAAVSLLIKTGLLPIEDDRLDQLENYVVKYGIEGRALWCAREWGWWGSRQERPDDVTEREQQSLRDVNRARERLVRAIGVWLEPTGGDGARTGRDWVTLLERVLRELHVPERLEAWAVEAEEDGRPAEAQEHRQVWAETMALLEELDRGLGTTEMDVTRFGQVLEAGLAELSLGLAPPTLDQVLIGDIERSRHPALRAVFLLGVNERVFPRMHQERAIFNDEDRAALGRGGVPLAGTRAHSLMEERYLGYVALTRAGEYLWISYPQADEAGKELYPSPYVDEVQRALPGLQVWPMPDPRSSRRMVMIGSGHGLSGRLALELGGRRPVEADDAAARAEWNRLYVECQNDDTLSVTVRPALQALVYGNRAELAPRGLEILTGRPVRGSVSRLESFAACPFQHYARYLLHLDEREEHKLEALELGTLSHGVLERFINEMIRGDQPLHELDPEAIDQALGRLAGDVARDLHDELLLSEARNRYLIERCRADVSQTLRAQRAWSRAGRLRPRAAELPFGFPGRANSLPPLVVDTPKGRRIELRGFIDRVDVAEVGRELLCAVIDYKRSRQRRLDITKVYHGLALQLLTYLLALQEHGETWLGRPLTPAGAFYITLRNPIEAVKHPSEKAEQREGGDEDEAAAAEARGLFDFTHLPALDSEAAEGRSEVLSAYVKKDGSPGDVNRTDVATHEQFAESLNHVRRKIGELGDRIIDGDVAVAPYRLGTEVPCTFCKYRSVCRFEYQLNRPRMLPRLNRSAALSQMGADEGH